jgi:serine/threonine protein kinase
VLAAVLVGFALLAAIAHTIFAKWRRDSTAADAAGQLEAQHPLLTKDGSLIDHLAVKLEPDSVIGRGAEGFVMRGKFNGARVAVKIVSLGMNANQRQSVVAEATQEVKLLQQLHHPNIVQLFGLTIKDTSMDTKLMLVMECCVRSLRDHLQDGHNDIQPVEVLGFLLDTCRGMMYLHSHNIIHRDLKPGNLLLSSDSNRSRRFTVKVADFGGSRFLQGIDGADTMTMTAGMGTPAYEAPGCSEGRTSKYSNAVDVYSFALTVHGLVSIVTLPLRLSLQVHGCFAPRLPRASAPRSIPLCLIATLVLTIWSSSCSKARMLFPQVHHPGGHRKGRVECRSAGTAVF